MVSRIEALIDAVGLHNRSNVPESPAYQLRNPLLLKSFAVGLRQETDEEGQRVFNDFFGGYIAAIYDVATKVSGRSRTRLKPDQPLTSLLAVYEVESADAVKSVVKFLRRALNDPAIRHDTPLSYFVPEAAEYFRNKEPKAVRQPRLPDAENDTPKDTPCASNEEPSI